MAHVAGLSIDSSGQPLQWFAVNRWVTDGPWLEERDFLDKLEAAKPDEDDSTVGRWLLALLQLYQAPLSDLLIRRDEQLQRHAAPGDYAAVFENRSIYTLATEAIALLPMLEKHLCVTANN